MDGSGAGTRLPEGDWYRARKLAPVGDGAAGRWQPAEPSDAPPILVRHYGLEDGSAAGDAAPAPSPTKDAGDDDGHAPSRALPTETRVRRREPRPEKHDADEDDAKARDARDGKKIGNGGGGQEDGRESEGDEKQGKRDGGDEKKRRAKKDDNKEGGNEKPPMPREKKILYAAIGGGIALVLIVAGVLYWLHARHFESTDDAFIDGYISQIGPQVAGRVIRLAVNDNQQVEAGQLLVELDPRDFQVRLEQARAQRANAAAQREQARAQISLQQATIDQQQAQVRVSDAELTQAQQDLARYRSIDPRAITRQTLDQSNATTRSAAARRDAARQGVTGARAQLEASRAQFDAAEAAIQTADADIRNAELQLSYTKIMAPQAGRITRRTVNLGNYVNVGQALLAVVPETMWVTANFKETQLSDMRPGQPVEIRVDAFSGRKLAGRVDSIQRGTGAVFSSLPAENATGNYVKVVQRVPVKITFEGDDWRQVPLAPGLSVIPRVTVR